MQQGEIRALSDPEIDEVFGGQFCVLTVVEKQCATYPDGHEECWYVTICYPYDAPTCS